MSSLSPRQVLSTSLYDRHRAVLRPAVLALKAARRVGVGEHLTFLFENASTVLYQVQEMLRVEGLDGPEDVLEQLETYAERLTLGRGLCATLLIEIPDAEARRRLLPDLQAAPASAYARLADGRTVDARLRGTAVDLSAVFFLDLPVDSAPIAFGVRAPERHEVALPARTRRALAQDLIAPAPASLLDLLPEAQLKSA